MWACVFRRAQGAVTWSANCNVTGPVRAHDRILIASHREAHICTERAGDKNRRVCEKLILKVLQLFLIQCVFKQTHSQSSSVLLTPMSLASALPCTYGYCDKCVSVTTDMHWRLDIARTSNHRHEPRTSIYAQRSNLTDRKRVRPLRPPPIAWLSVQARRCMGQYSDWSYLTVHVEAVSTC